MTKLPSPHSAMVAAVGAARDYVKRNGASPVLKYPVKGIAEFDTADWRYFPSIGNDKAILLVKWARRDARDKAKQRKGRRNEAT